jgi:MFS transporter, AAHS family, 4-hydroxybenzoate transporter
VLVRPALELLEGNRQLENLENLDMAAPQSRLDTRQMAVILCCLGLAMVEGFDNQAIGFVGPAIIRSWHLQAAAFGPILSAGLFGALFGSALGGVGDRYGRLPALAFTTLLFASGTLATAWATAPSQLVVLRFLTGIGLGGTLPNAMALAADLCPARIRATVVSGVVIGMPLGAGIGGFGVAALIAGSGWQSVFIVGGLVPLPVLLFLWLFSPRANPAVRTGRSPGSLGATFLAVLAPQYRTGTLMLWGATCLSVMLTSTLLGWLPTLLTERGIAARQAVLASVLLNIGALIGGLIIGRLSDKVTPYRVLTIAYLFGAASLALIGIARGQTEIFAAIFACALLALGGQTGIAVLTTAFYEGSIRASGIGASLAVGRLGAIFGPLLVSLMLSRGSGVPAVFGMGGIVGLLIAVVVAAMGYFTRRRKSVRP